MSLYRTVTDPAEVIGYIADGLGMPDPLIGFDTETMGEDGSGQLSKATDRWHAKTVGFSLSKAWGEAIYVPLRHDQGPNCQLTQQLKDALAALFQSGACAGHNLHFDAAIIAREIGMDMGLFRARHDTQIMAHCIGERSSAGTDFSSGLKQLAKKYLGVERPGFEDLFPPGTKSKDRLFRALDIETATPYAAADADDVLGLVQALGPLLDHWQVRATYDLEMGLFPEVLWMEARGVQLDEAYAKTCSDALAEFIKAAEEVIYARVTERLGRPPVVKIERTSKGEKVWKEEPLKLSSNSSLGALLFSAPPWGLGMHPIKLTAKQAPSVDEDVLERLAVQEDWLGWLLEVRAAAKVKGTYFDTFGAYCPTEEPGILHPNYKQFGAETGRTSSSGPNVQNLPKGQHIGADKAGNPIIPGVAPVEVNTRDMLVPRPGFYFVDMDWRAIEYRLIAGYSQDPGLVETFAKGIDIHVATYALMFGVDPATVTDKQRSLGKTINYALNFGAGAERLAGMLGVSVEEAKRLMALYNQGFALVAAWKSGIEDFAKRNKYVQTLFGRKRWLHFGGAGIDESKARKAYFAALREAVNMPVQGTAADLLKIVLVRLGPWLREHFPEVRTVLTTHDSITFEVPDAIDSAYFIGAVRPVVEFPADWQPGWPAVTADFVHGRIGWGSLKGDEDDEAAAPAQQEAPEPAAPQEAVQQAPVAELAPPPEQAGRTLHLKVHEPVNVAQITALNVFLQSRRGTGTVVLYAADQSYAIDNVSLSVDDRPQVAELTGWVQFTLEDPGAQLAQAVAGTVGT